MTAATAPGAKRRPTRAGQFQSTRRDLWEIFWKKLNKMRPAALAQLRELKSRFTQCQVSINLNDGPAFLFAPNKSRPYIESWPAKDRPPVVCLVGSPMSFRELRLMLDGVGEWCARWNLQDQGGGANPFCVYLAICELGRASGYGDVSAVGRGLGRRLYQMLNTFDFSVDGLGFAETGSQFRKRANAAFRAQLNQYLARCANEVSRTVSTRAFDHLSWFADFQLPPQPKSVDDIATKSETTPANVRRALHKTADQLGLALRHF